MKEILFRGQRIDNGEWVYGSLITAIVSKKYKSINTFIKLQDAVETNLETFVVKPESIGQFTGLLDKNKNKIFERDKVKAFGSVYDMVFNDGAFYLRKENVHHRLSRTIQDLEIIGNIHEDGDK